MVHQHTRGAVLRFSPAGGRGAAGVLTRSTASSAACGGEDRRSAAAAPAAPPIVRRQHASAPPEGPALMRELAADRQAALLERDDALRQAERWRLQPATVAAAGGRAALRGAYSWTERILGTGSYGQVFEVESPQGEKLAMKVVPLRVGTTTCIPPLEEVKIGLAVGSDHHVVGLCDVVLAAEVGQMTRTKLEQVLEFQDAPAGEPVSVDIPGVYDGVAAEIVCGAEAPGLLAARGPA
eukprot:TRINITY_DN33961_c0_g1_i3.p1 TRINITY_DN33961_c0_g1~~TRINITY_DN33961_c0_g1_i3.p1  ORF type:complete len:238 (+),score=23.86 TRINITY_DN33961_c0_g1_i3:143-856(+)